MAFPKKHIALLLLFLETLICFITQAHETSPTNKQSQAMKEINNTVSAILVFGDSIVDPGNNNYITTIFKSNFKPYGRDFLNHTPTGRFTNGRLFTDYIGNNSK